MRNAQGLPTRRAMMRSLIASSPLLWPGVFSHLLSDSARAADAVNPLAPKASHTAARAKRVIFLYLSGGVSHLDTFDPKPRLTIDDGQLVPADRVKQNAGSGGGASVYVRPAWKFRPRGKSGIETSDLFPHIGQCMDDICLIRSMNTDNPDHTQATLGLHTGSFSVARPSLGSWVSYGLGTVQQNLPSFVVLAPEMPYAGTQDWAADFLPGCHQGTRVLSGAEPVPNLNRRAASQQLQELELEFLRRRNDRHQEQHPAEPLLAARLQSFDTAFNMQATMPDVLNVSSETNATLSLYGLERGSTKGFAWQCLVARRMAERGVRFIELIDTGSDTASNWDGHSKLQESYTKLARNVDQPIAGLLTDLKQRGMLDDTLVVFTTEFGRTPWSDSPGGRNHHAKAYSSWLAGGGVKGGMVHGQTDEHGYQVASDGVHLHDFHATILHLLGLDHERLTYRYSGRDFRLTDVSGRVVHEILA
jgi:hypothetical protein